MVSGLFCYRQTSCRAGEPRGETAEMPGMYHDGDYDLAGFAVGIVEKDQLIDGSTVVAGDSVIGIAASGPHSNGYSLIRKIAEKHDLNAPFGKLSLGETLMQPTRIYVKAIKAVLAAGLPIKAMAHITGGGITENVPRSLPDNVVASIKRDSWTAVPIFDWLQEHGNVAPEEMLRTFNCGIGFSLVVANENVKAVIDQLNATGENASVIGTIETGVGAATVSVA